MSDYVLPLKFRRKSTSSPPPSPPPSFSPPPHQHRHVPQTYQYRTRPLRPSPLDIGGNFASSSTSTAKRRTSFAFSDEDAYMDMEPALTSDGDGLSSSSRAPSLAPLDDQDTYVDIISSSPQQDSFPRSIYFRQPNPPKIAPELDDPREAVAAALLALHDQSPVATFPRFRTQAIPIESLLISQVQSRDSVLPPRTPKLSTQPAEYRNGSRASISIDHPQARTSYFEASKYRASSDAYVMQNDVPAVPRRLSTPVRPHAREAYSPLPPSSPFAFSDEEEGGEDEPTLWPSHRQLEDHVIPTPRDRSEIENRPRGSQNRWQSPSPPLPIHSSASPRPILERLASPPVSLDLRPSSPLSSPPASPLPTSRALDLVTDAPSDAVNGAAQAPGAHASEAARASGKGRDFKLGVSVPTDEEGHIDVRTDLHVPAMGGEGAGTASATKETDVLALAPSTNIARDALKPANSGSAAGLPTSKLSSTIPLASTSMTKPTHTPTASAPKRSPPLTLVNASVRPPIAKPVADPANANIKQRLGPVRTHENPRVQVRVVSKVVERPAVAKLEQETSSMPTRPPAKTSQSQTKSAPPPPVAGKQSRVQSKRKVAELLRDDAKKRRIEDSVSEPKLQSESKVQGEKVPKAKVADVRERKRKANTAPDGAERSKKKKSDAVQSAPAAAGPTASSSQAAHSTSHPFSTERAGPSKLSVPSQAASSEPCPYPELLGTLLEALALSRASSLPASAILRVLPPATGPATLAAVQATLAWAAGAGILGIIPSSGDNLPPSYFYEPARDPDTERAGVLSALIEMDGGGGGRREKRKYKQYYWKPVVLARGGGREGKRRKGGEEEEGRKGWDVDWE